MPIMNRRKASCFFCSKQVALGPDTKFHKNGRPSYFQCPHCSADNHLDQSGTIIDYVPETPEKEVPQFARPARPQSPTTESPSLCRQCQINQSIVYQAISQYSIPPEDDPHYRQVMEVDLPAYKENMERKWPPLCARCAPKVTQKIRQSNYQAKIMGLAQMRARTAETLKVAQAVEWRDVLVWAGRGFLWCSSYALFLAWHLSGAATKIGGEGKVETSEAMEIPTASLKSCLWNSYDKLEIEPACFDITSGVVNSKWILLTLLGIGWTYQLMDKKRHREKKLVGLEDHFKVECLVWLIRLVSWYWLRSGPASLSPHASQRAHLGLFFFTVLSLLYSLTCVRLEDPPSLSFHETEVVSPLLSPGLDTEDILGGISLEPASMRAPTPKRPTAMRFPSETPRASSAGPTLQPFSLPPPDLHSYREHRSVSPARTEFSDADAMDWTATTPEDSPIRPTNYASPFAPIPAPSTNKLSTTSFAGSNNVFAAMRQQMQPPQASPTKNTLPPIRPADFHTPERYKKLPLAPARFNVPPSHNDELDDVLTSMMGGRLTLKDADEDSQFGDGTVDTPRRPGQKITHESVTAMAIRMLLGLICFFIPASSRIWWFAPCLIAIVWRGGMEGASPSNLTMITAALVTLMTGVSGMMMEMEGKRGLIDKLALAALGLTTITEVWGIFERISKEKRRRWWKEEEERARKKEVEIQKKEVREREMGSGFGSFTEGMGKIGGGSGASMGVQQGAGEKTPVRRSQRMQEKRERETPGMRSRQQQRGRKRESGGLGMGGLAL